MSDSLVIVESPAKARTLERYLGDGFKVLASYGHVRDLLPKDGAVDPENDFLMKYELIKKNARSVDAISNAVKKAAALYLATDPDREGEAISWHLYELLKERGDLNGKKVHRIVFHEVTKKAVNDAIAHPRQLSQHLIDAQQTRRALDYLVGFNLSPLLWKKVQRGLSAGRVQSPALRLIAEREMQIGQFKPREYWTIEADLEHKMTPFRGRLIVYLKEKLKQFSIAKEFEAVAAQQALTELADGILLVKRVIKKQRKQHPAPPFITSTLQQEAARKLGFTTQRTMRIAQQLYEGIDIGQEVVGLITYMRTDSVHLAKEAVTELKEYIKEHYGQHKLPAQTRYFKTSSKNAQEAHEAIRPTSVKRSPRAIKDKLTDEQYKLYELIWKRVVACQMQHAVIDMVSVELECGPENLFRANGSTIADAGFMDVYLEGRDDVQATIRDERALPIMQEGDRVKLHRIRSVQHFTEPPPRYTEASLVKSLEDYGIGRPSTYANIIQTLLQREYVEMDKKRFMLTNIGKIVNQFLTQHFTDYVDYEFTARLEDELDGISRGEKGKLNLLQQFWGAFSAQIKDKEKNISRSDVAQTRVLGNDPETGRTVSVRMGRYGPYAQIGTKDDEQKPRFAGLRPGQSIETITFAEVIQLFKLPILLSTASMEEQVSVGIGRFGPYIRYGDKFVSIKGDDDPYTITLERALELIEEKKKADAKKQIKHYANRGISVLNGRYGPYVTDGKKNAKIPKDKEPASLSLEECICLLTAASSNRNKRKTQTKKKAKKSSQR